VGAGAARLLRLSLRQLYRCGVVRHWLPVPMRRHQAQPEGFGGMYIQWGISLPLGDLTCAVGVVCFGVFPMGYSQWGISLPSRDNSAPTHGTFALLKPPSELT
jgi:hypothetical protein